MKDHIIEMPAEWNGIIPTDVFIDEGKRIVEEAGKRGIPLRLLGGVAIRIHCSEFLNFAKQLSRLGERQQEYTDLDLITYSKFRKKMRGVLHEIGYEKRPTTMSSAATQRQIYFHPKGWFSVDVFFDKLLAANHPLDFRGRLHLDSPTITPTDLLLEKLQIVFPSEKDVKDVILLLKAHEVHHGEESNRINTRNIAEKLGKDWGFWYTVTNNLKGLKEYLVDFNSIDDAEKQDINRKIASIVEAIDASPKSAKWKMRSLIGTKRKWYNPVETSETVGEFGIWRLREKK